jgi:Phage stabilisation protein.
MPTSQTEKEVARIPLVGVHTTRTIDNSTTDSGSSGTIGLGIIGIMVIGRVASSDKDQRFVNVIFEKITNPFTGKVTFYTVKRPGFAVENTPEAGSVGNEVKVWSSQGNGDSVISSFGDINSTIYNGDASLGSITGITQTLDEAIIGTTPHILITSHDNTGWYYPDGGALTQISDVDFPGNAGKTITGHFVTIDGYTFIAATDGTIWNSDLNSISAWSATSFLNAQMYPDKLVGLSRFKNQLVALGKDTIEFFHIAANATGSPLERTDNGFIRIGCASTKGYVQLEDTIAWVSASDRGGCSIYVLDGFTPKRISTSTIDAQLALVGPDTVKLACCKFLGKTLIFAILNNITFVHCLEDNIWTEWTSASPLWTSLSVASSGSWKIYSVSSQTNSGKVYSINPTSFVYQDDGTNYTLLIQTSKVDFDNAKRKFFSRLNVIGDIQPNSTILNIAWADDDYNTFSNSRSVDMSSNNPYLTQLGSARRRAFRLSNTTNGPLRLEALELEYTEGLH